MNRRPARSPIAALLVVTLLMIRTAPNVAGAAPKLDGPTVNPMTGAPATVFVFSVQFRPGTETSATVSVIVAGTTLPLVRNGGPVANQTWTGSRTLPVGTWTATFSGTTVHGVNPEPVSVMPIEVSGPTPTPAPTPPPTATAGPIATPGPTPRPTPLPGATPPGATATPIALATAFGTTVTDPSGSPPGARSPTESEGAFADPSPAAVPVGSRPFNVPVEGVVALGLLAAVAVAAAVGERRRRRAVEAFRASQASLGEPQAGDLEPGWDPTDDETVATIDYEGLDESDQDA